jgi:hypothetical protein
MSLIDHLIGQPSLGHLSHLDSRYHSRSKKPELRPVQIEWKNFVFLVLVPYGEFRLSSDDFYLDKSLVQGLIHVVF